MTETCGVITMMEPADALPKAGSAGKAACMSLCLVGATAPMPPPVRLRNLGQGPSTTPGYWQRPEATAGAFTDGWLRTGDAALIDKDGFYYIVDR
jgi:fatty-acyl-CoA synthase